MALDTRRAGRGSTPASRQAMMSVALSREELDAARNLVNSGFPRQAISRAYSAAFYAARAALEATGEPSPKTHSGCEADSAILRGHAEHRCGSRSGAQPTRHRSNTGGLRRASPHDRGSERRDCEGAASGRRDRTRHRGQTGNFAAAIIFDRIMQACRAVNWSSATLSVCTRHTQTWESTRSRPHRPTVAWIC